MINMTPESVKRTIPVVMGLIAIASCIGFWILDDPAFAVCSFVFGIGALMIRWMIKNPIGGPDNPNQPRELSAYERALYAHTDSHIPVYVEYQEDMGKIVACSCERMVAPDVWIERHWVGDPGLMAKYIALSKGADGR